MRIFASQQNKRQQLKKRKLLINAANRLKVGDGIIFEGEMIKPNNGRKMEHSLVHASQLDFKIIRKILEFNI